MRRSIGRLSRIGTVWAWPLISAGALCGAAIAAERAFTGEDAAYIDWAWKSCGLIGTDKQHTLADSARTKGGDAFQKTYEQSYYKISGATPQPSDVKKMCEQVTGWYGASGSKIAALVTVKTEQPAVAGTTVGSKASSQSSAGGKRSGGGGGGRRGGG